MASHWRWMMMQRQSSAQRHRCRRHQSTAAARRQHTDYTRNARQSLSGVVDGHSLRLIGVCTMMMSRLCLVGCRSAGRAARRVWCRAACSVPDRVGAVPFTSVLATFFSTWVDMVSWVMRGRRDPDECVDAARRARTRAVRRVQDAAETRPTPLTTLTAGGDASSHSQRDGGETRQRRPVRGKEENGEQERATIMSCTCHWHCRSIKIPLSIVCSVSS